MDASKIRPININLKQIQTVDSGKQASKARADSSKPGSKASTESNKPTGSSDSSQPTQGSQDSPNKAKRQSTGPPVNQNKSTAADQAAKQKSDSSSGNLKQSKPSSSSDKTSPKKTAGDQANSNQTKKLKVPFAVKPASTTKSEPKYSNENKNLRLLNQADETRKELLNMKIKKAGERSIDRPADRSNLKSIDTSNKAASLGKPANGQNRILPDKSKPLLPTPTAFGKPPVAEPKANRIANFYLKSVPDHFNYLDDNSDDIIDIDSFRNLSRAKSQRKPMPGDKGHPTTGQPANQFTDPIASQPKNGDQFDSNNFSSQFLKSQKESLEIAELINYKITNENEKFRTRSVINHLMKVLIEYKRSTYQPKLVEELNASLQKFSSDS